MSFKNKYMYNSEHKDKLIRVLHVDLDLFVWIAIKILGMDINVACHRHWVRLVQLCCRTVAIVVVVLS